MEQSDFEKLTQLCHITFNDEEKQVYLKSLEDLLDYVRKLDELDTENVKACYTVHESFYAFLRPDNPEEPLPRELFFSNVPAHIAGMVRVPPVLSGS